MLRSTLTNLAMITLYQRADQLTWMGPTPQLCCDELVRMRADVLRVAGDLTTSATLLERRADEADLAAEPRLLIGAQ